MSIGVVHLMYPAVATAGCNACAQWSRMILWASDLLICQQQNVWSPAVKFRPASANWSVVWVIDREL